MDTWCLIHVSWNTCPHARLESLESSEMIRFAPQISQIGMNMSHNICHQVVATHWDLMWFIFSDQGPHNESKVSLIVWNCLTTIHSLRLKNTWNSYFETARFILISSHDWIQVDSTDESESCLVSSVWWCVQIFKWIHVSQPEHWWLRQVQIIQCIIVNQPELGISYPTKVHGFFP